MKRKILIVDDDPGVQEIFKLIFNKAGFDVTVVGSAKPVMDNDFVIPDVFLLDKQLPGIDGLALCRHLKSSDSTKDIPVLIVSAAPDLQELAIGAGADDFIEKPFVTQILLEKIGEAISRREKENQE